MHANNDPLGVRSASVSGSDAEGRPFEVRQSARPTFFIWPRSDCGLFHRGVQRHEKSFMWVHVDNLRFATETGHQVVLGWPLSAKSRTSVEQEFSFGTVGCGSMLSTTGTIGRGARFTVQNASYLREFDRMPWTANEAERHTHKATTPALKELWAKVANESLERTGDEGRAIREANAVIARQAGTS